MLTAEQVQFFRDNGFLKIPNAIAPEEVERLRDATQQLIDDGPASDATPGERSDFQYGRVKGQDKPVLRRIEYVQGKGEPFLHLLAHPVLLDAVQKIVGEQFVPTFDSCVIKMPGNGVEVPWHRDGGGPDETFYYDDPQSGQRLPSVNFDIYLDRADETSGALWVIPGSVHEQENRAPELARKGEYETVSGAIRVDMEPGDMLLHNTMLYHGSPETRGGNLRRVIYYEFRDMRYIDALLRPEEGVKKSMAWPPEWTQRRLAVLQKALAVRQEAGLDIPFVAHPIEDLRVSSDEARNAPTRVSHPGRDEAAAKRAA